MVFSVLFLKVGPFFRHSVIMLRIIIGSDHRPETKQGIEGKIVRFRSGRARVRDRVRDKDRRSEAINFGAC